MATRLDEGLEDFFSRRVMDESSRCGIQAHTPSFSRPRGPRKAPVSTHLKADSNLYLSSSLTILADCGGASGPCLHEPSSIRFRR